MTHHYTPGASEIQSQTAYLTPCWSISNVLPGNFHFLLIGSTVVQAVGSDLTHVKPDTARRNWVWPSQCDRTVLRQRPGILAVWAANLAIGIEYHDGHRSNSRLVPPPGNNPGSERLLQIASQIFDDLLIFRLERFLDLNRVALPQLGFRRLHALEIRREKGEH